MRNNPPSNNGKVIYSNSYFFEYALGWKALLVEANPTNAAKLVKNRPDAWTHEAAICAGDSSQFQGETATGGVLETMTENHKNGWIKDGMPVYDVQCRLWEDLLKEHGIEHVDMFFVDVEGGEHMVLSAMDWSVTVDHFVIEHGNAENLVQLLQPRGYEPSAWSLKDYCIQVRTVQITLYGPEWFEVRSDRCDQTHSR
jgi:FkbM family methyltransferase